MPVTVADDLIVTGRAHLNGGRTREATSSFISAVQAGSLSPGMVESVVARLLEFKDVPNALLLATHAVVRTQKSALCLAAYGRAMMAADLCFLAEAPLRAACLDDPLSERHARMLGVCLLKLKKFEEARVAIDQAERVDEQKATVRSYVDSDLLTEAISSKPNWAWVAYQLGLNLYEGRQYGDAAGHLATAVENSRRGSPLHRVACAMYADTLRRSLARGEAKVAIHNLIEEHGTSSSWDALYGGLIAYTEGRVDVAEQLFSMVLNQPVDMLSASTGASTFVNVVSSAKPSPRVPLSVNNATVAHESDKYVIVAAADARYVTLFAETFIASSLYVAGDRHIHLHVLNPTSESEHELKRIQEQVPWLRLSSSTEYVDYPKPRPYYATARFLVAGQLLDLFRRPLLIADIDAVLEKDIEPYLPELLGFDIGVKKNPSEIMEFPWTSVFATFGVYMPTAQAQDFLKDISDYFWDRFDITGKKDSWWIDQNALYYAERRTTLGSGTKVIDLGKTGARSLITANMPMESKSLFISRMKPRFPLNKLRTAAG